VGDVRQPPGKISEEGAAIMFLLAHSLHLTGPLAVMFSVAMIGLRVFIRRGHGNSGHGRRS
jgi:hypothetical protein